jgi:glutathione S-transferase
MEVAQSLAFEKHRPDPSEPWIERQARKIGGAFGELERMYAARALAARTPLDLGDIAVGTTLVLFEFGLATGLIPETDELRWRGRYPALTAAIEILAQRPSFARTGPEMMDVDLQATVA